MSDRDPLIELAEEMGRELGLLDRREAANAAAVVDLLIEQSREISELRRRLDELEASHVGRPAPGPRLLGGMDMTHGTGDNAA